MFVGRKTELKFLQDKYNSPKAQLVILYGRRRVGKTETLREFCRGKPHVFYSCTQSTDKVQLARFSQQMLREDLHAKRYISQFSDWEMAFRSISDLPFGDHKKLVVIDEFPYMCKGDHSIPSILQNLWDMDLKDQNVMLVLCGSAMSFIEKELLAEKNPLYGRATGIYKMKAMGFYDAIQFFPNYSDLDKVLAYAVLGGIPHYLNQFSTDLSIEENIKQNILTRGSVLYSEVEFLLHQELRETPMYNSVIEAIATGSKKLNEISQRAMVDDTAKTSVYLRNLIELGIVQREFSVDAKSKERTNTGRGIYRLTDNFFRFWYAYGFSNLSQLEDGDVDGVYDYMVRPDLNRFAALPFEDICQEFVRELQKRNALPFRYSKMGRWLGRTTVRDQNTESGLRQAETEIDLLAISQDAQEYLVGECKFKHSPFSYSEYLDTTSKLSSWKKDSVFYYALFSASGFDQKIVDIARDTETLKLYNLENIVHQISPV